MFEWCTTSIKKETVSLKLNYPHNQFYFVNLEKLTKLVEDLNKIYLDESSNLSGSTTYLTHLCFTPQKVQVVRCFRVNQSERGRDMTLGLVLKDVLVIP